MSTRTTRYYHDSGDDLKHKLTIHIYNDVHESNETLVVELGCTTCYCSYQFLMTEHLGAQLAALLEKAQPMEK